MKEKSRQELKKLLKKCKVDETTFGIGPTKTLDELFEEWRLGETNFYLEKGKLVRFVKRAQIRVRYQPPSGVWLVLVETHQHLANGSIRHRKRKWSVGEKRRADESYEEAAVRGIKDELGITVQPKRLRPLERAHEPIKKSSSYPGLLNDYESQRYELVLTETEFREQYEEVQPGRKTAYFSWYKEEESKRRKKRS